MRSALLYSITLSICLWALPPDLALAGGSKADYKRARAMAGRLRGKVRNEHILETWANNDTLLFRLTEDDGTWQLMRVGTKTGTREPAFDHKAVAKALGTLIGTTLKPGRLPITPIDIEDGELRVQHKARVFGIKRKTSAVRELDLESIQSLHLEPRRVSRSKGGGDDTAILFVNRSGQAMELIWLDHGGREKSYGLV